MEEACDLRSLALVSRDLYDALIQALYKVVRVAVGGTDQDSQIASMTSENAGVRYIKELTLIPGEAYEVDRHSRLIMALLKALEVDHLSHFE